MPGHPDREDVQASEPRAAHLATWGLSLRYGYLGWQVPAPLPPQVGPPRLGARKRLCIKGRVEICCVAHMQTMTHQENPSSDWEVVSLVCTSPEPQVPNSFS